MPDGTLLFIYDGGVFRVVEGVQPPKAGSVFFARHLKVREGDDFLGLQRAHDKLQTAGLAPSVVAQETQSFPRLGYERLDHIRSLDTEGTVPKDTWPKTVERIILCGQRA